MLLFCCITLFCCWNLSIFRVAIYFFEQLFFNFIYTQVQFNVSGFTLGKKRLKCLEENVKNIFSVDNQHIGLPFGAA